MLIDVIEVLVNAMHSGRSCWDFNIMDTPIRVIFFKISSNL